MRRRVLKHVLASIQNKTQDEAVQRENSGPDQAVIDLFTNDLHFLLPLLRKYPKCYWIWNYRLWLLEESTDILPPAIARKFWEQELGLVGKMLSLDSRNFHGWGYRRTVVKALETFAVQESEASKSLTEQEFDYTTKMINTNLSNFSAWHNRSKLIPRLLNERHASEEERRKLLNQGLLYFAFVA